MTKTLITRRNAFHQAIKKRDEHALINAFVQAQSKGQLQDQLKEKDLFGKTPQDYLMSLETAEYYTEKRIKYTIGDVLDEINIPLVKMGRVTLADKARASLIVDYQDLGNEAKMTRLYHAELKKTL